MNLVLIDNYDSFTYNVYQYLVEQGHTVYVVRNDKITVDEVGRMKPDAIFLSPGPGRPENAGICVDLIKTYAGKISIFGICLGHQAIGLAFGGVITNADSLFHGKTSRIISLNKGIMTEFKDGFTATRYHSLVVERSSLPDCFDITCETEDGQIMGILHKEYNIEGLQFHPESILTDEGKRMLRVFLSRTKNLENQASIDAHRDEHFFQKKEIVHTVENRIGVEQFCETVKCSAGALDVFVEMQKTFGKTNSMLMDSASGPRADGITTFIGIFPQFEISINKKRFKIVTEHKDISAALETVFSHYYKKSGDEFLMESDKFSDIFDILANTFQLKTFHNENLPINCGLAGYFSYEYLHYIEEVPRIEENVLGLPEVHLKFFSVILKAEKDSNDYVIIENQLAGLSGGLSGGVKEVLQKMDGLSTDSAAPAAGPEDKEKEAPEVSNIEREVYLKNAVKAKKYIYDGDIFQVQLGQRITFELEYDSMDLYKKLREINPSPYMFYWDSGDYQLISNSPELQLKIIGDEAKIRPIAGTSKGKGSTPEERKKIIEEFESDEKESAEHVMLVDLARNDLGRLANPGSVHVSQLKTLEEYSHVFHLTSTVEAAIPAELNKMRLFESTFPAGTLTGAPKVRSMEIISEMETEVRGPYGGAFGFFDFNGNIVSSIIIRTVLRIGKKTYLQASAGFVADSVPEAEWNETIHKMRAVKKAVLSVAK